LIAERPDLVVAVGRLAAELLGTVVVDSGWSPATKGRWSKGCHPKDSRRWPTTSSLPTSAAPRRSASTRPHPGRMEDGDVTDRSPRV